MTKSPKRTARARTKSVQKHTLIAGVDGPNPGEVKRLDVTPEEFFKAWSRKDRETLIEALIDSLDAEAGDADLEETGDAEPSLGFQAGDIFVGRGCESGGSCDDREVEDEHDESTNDDEPSLAATENHASVPLEGWYGAGERRDHSGDQSRWAQGSTDDAEGDEHDGREPDSDEGGEAEKEDNEPSLGWTDWEAARGRSYAGTGDRGYDLEEDAGDMPESDPAEHGIADRDGILEQFGHDPRFGTFHPGAAAI